MFKGIVFERIMSNGSIFRVAISPEQMRFLIDTGFVLFFVALSCLLGLVALFLAWMLFRVYEQSRNPNVREINVLADLPLTLSDLKQSLGSTLSKLLSVMAMQQKSLSSIRSTQKEHTSYFVDFIGVFKSWQNSIASGFDDMRERLAQIADSTSKIASVFLLLKNIEKQLDALSDQLQSQDLALVTGLQEVNDTLHVIRASQNVVEENPEDEKVFDEKDNYDDFMESMRAMNDDDDTDYRYDDDDTGYRH